MSNTKFTPGEWQINHWSLGGSGISCVAINKNGINYYTGDAVYEKTFGIRSKIDPMKHNVQGSFEGAHIADIADFSEESEANARLIASAPEMYEALKEIVRISDRKHDAWDRAKAALAKAEGGNV